MTRRAYTCEPVPCTWHMQVSKERVKRFGVDEIDVFSTVSGCPNLKPAHFQYCFNVPSAAGSSPPQENPSPTLPVWEAKTAS
jgi:hypothetical protein